MLFGPDGPFRFCAPGIDGSIARHKAPTVAAFEQAPERWWDWWDTKSARVRQVLQDAGGQRAAELREYGADYLVDLDLFVPRYTGAEGVWSDNSLAWIAYASHEGTVAFGGLLATALTTRWPDVRRWHWSGW
ncbi:hypothetical protein AB0J85_24175 [Micromonospora echinofusca]|uniref:hypothetical protein n=1 Tax=Micromonospora echinofusca TaxID=47858 RepID=UPI000CA787D8|nr:hypothetical protein [Micromonospora sp. MSM11]MCL7458315.1 hypothetical protein [Micromonospora sp. MSM11]